MKTYSSFYLMFYLKLQNIHLFITSTVKKRDRTYTAVSFPFSVLFYLMIVDIKITETSCSTIICTYLSLYLNSYNYFSSAVSSASVVSASESSVVSSVSSSSASAANSAATLASARSSLICFAPS